MEALQVVCPHGLFPLPNQCNIHLQACDLEGYTQSSSHGVEHHLLGQLQVLNRNANRLVKLASVNREQGADNHAEDVQTLDADALQLVQHTLMQAALAKQPLLLISSQHSSCFCQLLEQLHLLDALHPCIAAGLEGQPFEHAEPLQGQQAEQQQEWRKEQHIPFFRRLEQQLQHVQGTDTVLAALIAHCQQNFVAGSKFSNEFAASTNSGKAEAIDVGCLASIQEQHSAARALPILLRLYFTNHSRSETMAAGKPEPLTAKMLERCLNLLAAKPVVPGYADAPICLVSILEDCQQLQEVLAARKLKLPVQPMLLDPKSAAKLDHAYSMQAKLLPLLQQHDELCDLLSRLALEVKQAVVVDRDVNPKAFSEAEQLMVDSINFVSAAKNSMLELDAWRLLSNSAAQQWQQQPNGNADEQDMCNRFALKEEDVVPFMDVLGATKGLAGLLVDSSSWLQQLLQVNSVKQLQDFAAGTLPALAKLYPRNKRVQSLIKKIFTTLQGHQVELHEEMQLPSYATSMAGDAAVSTPMPGTPPPQTPTAAECQQQLFRRQSGPVAEGMEGPGLFKKLSSKMSPLKSRPQQQQQRQLRDSQAEAAPSGDSSGVEQEMVEAAIEAAAIAAAASQQAAADFSGAAGSENSAKPSAAAAPDDSYAAAIEEIRVQQLAMLEAYATAEAQQVASQPGKKSLLKKLKKSMGSSSKKCRPEPSPAPELCSAPAALAVQARAEYEALLSEVAAEANQGELHGAIAAAAAAAETEEWTGDNAAALTLHSQPVTQRGNICSLQLRGDGSNSLTGLSSMNSLNTATLERPPELPWEASGGMADKQQQSPRSVASATAAFENKIAASRRSSRLSNTSPAGPALAATSSSGITVGLDLPPLNLSAVLNADDPVEAAALELAQTAGADVDSEGNPIPCSPHSARKFHFFKFKSILQHHEKLSTGVLPASMPAAVVDETADAEAHPAAATDMGAGARFMAALSLRRRTSVASAVLAATAAVEGEELAVSAVDAAQVPATAGSGDIAFNSCSLQTQSEAAAESSGPLPCATQGADMCDAADVPACTGSSAAVVDQPSKQGKVAGIMGRVFNRTFPRGLQAPAVAVDGSSQQQRQGFKGLNFTAKLKKAVVDRRHTITAEGAVASDCLPALQLDSPPPLACLMQLRVLLEQLMHEIKAETKKHLVMQLQLAAAAAAGTNSAKPDASIARPLRQVKAMIKAVHRMQLVLDYPCQLAAAADLSSFWAAKAYRSFFGMPQQVLPHRPAGAEVVGSDGRLHKQPEEQPQGSVSRGHSRADTKVLYNLLYEETSEDSPHGTTSSTPAKQQGEPPASNATTPQLTVQHAPLSRDPAELSFPAALLAACMQQLEKLPAELPLLVVQLLWDARGLLQSCGLLDKGLQLLRQQEAACMRCYMQQVVPVAYEHFKKVAAHQTVTYELLSSCSAYSLQPVQTHYFEALLREPLPVILQGDYVVEGPATVDTAVQLSSEAGALGGFDSTPINNARIPCLAAQQLAAQKHAQRLKVCLEQIAQQQAEAENLAIEQQCNDQQQLAPEYSAGALHGNSNKTKQCSNASSTDKVSKQHMRRRAKTKQRIARHGKEEAAPAVIAGQTPLMHKVELLKHEKQSLELQYQQATQALIIAQKSSLVDVRQWLLAGLVTCLKRDAAAIVACARASPPSAIVQLQTQTAILQRTHQLLSQYAPLPCAWVDLWEQADAANDADCESAATHAMVAGVLSMLDTAVYDSEARVLLPEVGTMHDAAGFVAPGSSWNGVLAEVAAALKPLGSFLGRQHMQALLDLSGPAGQQYMLGGLLARLEQEQEVLLEQLQSLQHKLSPGLLQLPPAERYHDAPAVLQFYQQQLSGALSDCAGCSAALGSLQRIGNCLALLHLMSVQQSVQATPVFMQVAPFLGIIGRPLTDAAAAAECFEYEGGPEPPGVFETATGVVSRSCTAGLFMPEIERMQPPEAALKVYQMQVQKELQYEQEMQDKAAADGALFDESLIKPGGHLARHRMWQASHFQRLLLGPDAEMVRGPALLLAQNAELRSWEATQAREYIGPCMNHVRRWAVKLQRQLQGLTAEFNEDEAEVDPVETSCNLGCQQDTQQQSAMALSGTSLPGQAALQAQVAETVMSADVRVTAGGQENASHGLSLASNPVEPFELEPQLEQQDQLLQHAQQSPTDNRTVAPQEVHQLQQQAPQGPLSLVHSNITVKPSSDSGQLEEGGTDRPFVSYDEGGDALPTPTSLQLDYAVPTASSQSTTQGVAAAASLTLKAGAANTIMTVEELSVAAEVAAVAAASVHNSPRAVAAVAAASVPSSPKAGQGSSSTTVSIWEAAGAAAAQISAGSVPPSLAKLAFRSLPSSAVVHPEAGVGVEQLLSGGQSGGGRTYGLAELVGEVSDAMSSARSDTGAAYTVLSDRSSRQVQLELLPDQQQQQHDGAPAALQASLEGQTSATGAAAVTGSTSALWELEKMRGDQDAAEGESDTDEPDDRAMSWQRPDGPLSPCISPRKTARQSRLQLSSGGANSQQTAESTVDLGGTSSLDASVSTAACSSSPCRVVVPRLMLSPGGTTAIGSVVVAGAAAGSKNAASNTEGSKLLQSSRGQLSSRSDKGAAVGEDGDEVDPEGSYPAPGVNDELFDSTCVELVRVKDENNILRGEVEFLRNQLQNRDTTLALLSGNLYTPRPSEPGAVVAQEALLSVASQPALPHTTARGSKGSTSQNQPHEAGAPDCAADRSTQAAAEHDVHQETGGITACPAAAQASDDASEKKRTKQTPEASPSTCQSQPKRDIAITAGLVKAAVRPGLSPEPSDIKQEPSKMSIRAQQPSPAPPESSEDESGSCADNSSDASSIAGGGAMAGRFSAATRQLKLPTAIPMSGRGSDQAAQLAVALSALKFALLMEAATAQAGDITSRAAATGPASAAATPQVSPLKRLKKAAMSTVAGANLAEANSSAGRAVAEEQPVRPGGVAMEKAALTATQAQASAAAAAPTSLAQSAAAALARGCAAQQHPLGSGRIAGGRYGDGPLLAAAVLLQLTGQSRKHALLDATSRIAYWVEYDAVRSNGLHAAAGDANISAVVPSGLRGPGGIAPSAADGVMQPKPRSKKRQDEAAEEEARLKQQEAAQQVLLQRLAAAARQAERVAKDGSSIAASFAPPAPAHNQTVRMEVYRVEELSLSVQHAAGAAKAGSAAATMACSGSKYSSLGGSVSQGGTRCTTAPSQEHAVLAVPVKPEVVKFAPCVRPWMGLQPSNQPIQTHPALPMPRPRPLLLPSNMSEQAATGVLGRDCAQQTAAAGGIIGPAGRLLPGVGVHANAGLVAAARAVHAKEALLAAMPRAAVYSLSVMSDHNRSGMHDDGYSKAPSVPEVDSVEDISPRRAGRHNTAAAAARLGGKHVSDLGAGQVQGDQRIYGAAGGFSGREASSPNKSPTRSPSKRQSAVAQAGGLLASLVS